MLSEGRPIMNTTTPTSNTATTTAADGNPNPETLKTAMVDPPRFLIRIPRSAAASPIIVDPPSDNNNVNHRSIGLAGKGGDSSTNQTVSATPASNWCVTTPGSQNLPIGTFLETTTKCPATSDPILTEMVDDKAINVTSLHIDSHVNNHCKNDDLKKTTKQPHITPEHLPKMEGGDASPLAIEFGPLPDKSTLKGQTVIEDRQEGPLYLGCIDYEPFRPPRLRAGLRPGSSFDIRIPIGSVMNPRNPALMKRCLWGGENGIYTDDSDVVAVIRHQGLEVPPSTSGILRVHVEVLPPRTRYVSLDQNGLRSRSWGGGISTTRHRGYSIRVTDLQAGRPPSRQKRPILSINHRDSRVLCFSSKSQRPMLHFTELLLDPLTTKKRLIRERVSLYLVGKFCEYQLRPRVENNDDGDNETFIILKDNNVLFDGLHWKDIVWVTGGLVIRKTFLNLIGYYW